MRTVRCPTCRRETPRDGDPVRPFCSERCKLLDLAAWADGHYRIPGEPVPSEPDTPGDEPFATRGAPHDEHGNGKS